MPLFSVAGMTSLAPGEKLAVLNAENLASAAAAQGVAFAPIGGGPVPLTVLNATAQTVTLQASGDGTNWYPYVDADEQAVTVATVTALQVLVSPGLFYRAYNGSGSAITAGTIWFSR
jgi:hypothetical protein